jgi:diketogulonate reductase-like aldo/keto reductase
MEDLLDEGLVRAIGVANFDEAQTRILLASCRHRPQLDQIELHPQRARRELVEFLRGEGVAVMAHCPLGRGRAAKHQFFAKIGRRHGASAAQVVLRWHRQKGRAVIPKSVKPERVRENADIFDFELSPEEMAAIDRQNIERSVLKPPFAFDEDGWAIA